MVVCVRHYGFSSSLSRQLAVGAYVLYSFEKIAPTGDGKNSEERLLIVEERVKNAVKSAVRR